MIATANGNYEPSDEQIWELNVANSSLRASLIMLIIVVIIFAILQLIKLIYQVRRIRNKADVIYFYANFMLPFLHRKKESLSQ